MNNIISNLLDSLDEDSKNHTKSMKEYLCQQIRNSKDGHITFESWMQHALYEPNIGYYSSNKNKLSSFSSSKSLSGDFITAPELTSIFAKTLSKQIIQILEKTNTKKILEFGAGTGKLALDIIKELDKLGVEVDYEIIEISNNLRLIQKENLQPFIKRVKWLTSMPHQFSGCIIANEVVDAMPVKVFEWGKQGNLFEKHVGLDNNNNFFWINKLANKNLKNTLIERMDPIPGYISEINLIGEAWLKTVLQNTTNGVLLIIDYGFPRSEYYHFQRNTGTLMCHLHHIAYSNPFLAPGIQDITTHVDFTSLSKIAKEEESQVIGYTSMARFLLNCGIVHIIDQIKISNIQERIKVMSPVQKLLSENEMGELFKVMAIGINLNNSNNLIGFTEKNRLESILT